MESLRALIVALPLVMGLLLTAPVSAASLFWTLGGVTFDDLGHASGTFTTDASTGGLLSFDITTTDGELSPGFHYDGSTASIVGNTSTSFLLHNNDSFGTYLFFSFINPLTSAGVELLHPRSRESYNSNPERFVLVGNASTIAAVPEPETYAMLLAGLGLLGFAARRRKQAEAA